MANQRTKTDCRFYETQYCSLLNMSGCDSCMVAGMEREAAERLQKDLDVTLSLMPKEGISQLFVTDKCVLCKREPGERAWYADADIGNLEPKTTKSNFIGMKTIARAGSLIPLQIACCEDCRKRLLKIEYLPAAVTLLICVAALTLMSIRPLRESLMRVHTILPIALFLAVTGAACWLGGFLRKRLIKGAEEKTYLRVFDIPQLAGMQNNGWFEINENRYGVSRYVFAKKRMRQGICTGDGSLAGAEAPKAQS